jgi:hypothetical protein
LQSFASLLHLTDQAAPLIGLRRAFVPSNGDPEGVLNA